jgi:hypothetical protein
MATPGCSPEDALRALTNRFEELTASIASRDAQREEEMSALTMRIADLNNRVVTEPVVSHLARQGKVARDCKTLP